MTLRDLAGRVGRALMRSRMLPDLRRDVLRNQDRLRALERRIDFVQQALGRIEARQISEREISEIHAAEFRVYSQWGEDGIVHWLCARVDPRPKRFVELGVESYEEANTRWLLMSDRWSGLVVDAVRENIERLRGTPLFWNHDLHAVQAFVTRENVNRLLRDNGFRGPIGLLSIDLDGMDYWIWEALDAVEPAIVVVEYNYRFGDEDAVTVPYDPSFDRRTAHPSLLYYGASLPALCDLGARKGYAFVGCGSHGINAFFVRRDLLPSGVRALSAREGFVAGRFCEAHDADGNRVEMSQAQQARLVRSLPLERVGGGFSPPGP